MWCMLMHAMHHQGHDEHAAHAAAPPSESLSDILKRRFAMGEITRQQFEEMSHILGLTYNAPGEGVIASAEHHR